MIRRTQAALLLVCSVLGLTAVTQIHVTAQPAAEPVVQASDPDGSLHVPSDCRFNLEFLGSWAVAADSGTGSKELHVVYASRGTVNAYRAGRTFPDGTVLVKEVYATNTGEMTTGTVSHADKLKGWFVMVRDTHNTHPGNRLWGDGWGWSWFDAGNPIKTTTVSYRNECQGCHIPARASNWIYVDGYPPLK